MSTKTFANDTSNRTKKQWLQGLLVLFIGLTIAHFGITLFLISSLGSDPMSLFIQVVAQKIGITFGTCHVALQVILMVVMLITTKNYIKAGTVVCAFCGGWIIDFFWWMFGDLITADSHIIIRLVVLILGCIFLGIGMSVVIESNSGTGPNDLIAIILTDEISKHRKVQLRFVRMTCDFIFAGVGILLGGTFGIGTIIAVFLVGPVVQFFLPISRKIIGKVVCLDTEKSSNVSSN